MAEVSVIVPVYKAEKYLRRCVDSILAQTFTDFELILVDDGSPDNCGTICDEYYAKDSRVTVIHKANGGVSSARNVGLDAASGKYIMFCDSDDFVSPDWCNTLFCAIQQYPAMFLCHDVERVECVCNSVASSLSSTAPYMVQASFLDLYKRGISAYTFNKIFDSEILRSSNLRFNENVHLGEDAIFCAQYCQRCKGCVYIDQPLYYYVQNPDSAMHRYYGNLFELHLPLFSARLLLLKPDELPEYCDIWLYQFLNLFENVFDSRNSWTFFKKLQYNQRMIRTEEFRCCLEHATGKNENPLVMKILRTHNYYFFWLFDQLVKLKGKLRRKAQ